MLVALAVRTVPSAVTISTERSASQLRPYARCRCAHAAAEGQPGDAGLGDLAAGHDQTVPLGGGVDVGPAGAGPDAGGAARRVDGHRGHRRQVDHQAVVADGAPGDLVPAAPDAHRRPVGPGRPRGRRRRRRGSCTGRSPRDAGRSARSTPGGPRRSGASAGSMTSPVRVGAQVGDEGVVAGGDGRGHGGPPGLRWVARRDERCSDRLARPLHRADSTACSSREWCAWPVRRSALSRPRRRARAVAAGRRRRAGRRARPQAPRRAGAAGTGRGPHGHRRPGGRRPLARRPAGVRARDACTATSPGCGPTWGPRRPV